MTIWRGWSTPPTNGSCSAPASGGGISQPTASSTSGLGLAAARAALTDAKVDALSIDLIVLATSTPDNTFPSSAVSVQAGLGITQGAAFDLQAVCSGFVYGMAIADGLLRSGAHKRALVHPRRRNILPHSRHGKIAARACCSAMGRARSFLKRSSRGARVRTAAFLLHVCARMVATSPSFMSMAGPPRHKQSGICAWRVKRSSALPSVP